ncbi:hypothetical protein C8J56DRAFT_911894 [Mycena floridula]|nr:hypothetical protein C8J56DRAFT_911894 [Mycena floridula]
MLSGLLRFSRARVRTAAHRRAFQELYFGPAVSHRANHEILLMLKAEAQKSKLRDNKVRTRNIHAAMKVIQSLDVPFTNSEQLPGISPGVKEIVSAFFKGEPPPHAPDMRVISLLHSVPGIGRETARLLEESGCRSLEDLQQPQFASQLGEDQKMSLKYHLLASSISRTQVEVVVDLVRSHIPSTLEFIPVGEYRRNFERNSMLEFLLFDHSLIEPPVPSKTDGKSARQRLKPPFRKPWSKEKGPGPLSTYITDYLSDCGVISDTQNLHFNQWTGFLRIPELGEDEEERLQQIEAKQGSFTRANITYAPSMSRGTAMLFLTGDQEFLKYICTQAQGMGLYLDEYGLWRPTSPTVWDQLSSETEAQVFEELGLDFVNPDKRNFANLRRRK